MAPRTRSKKHLNPIHFSQCFLGTSADYLQQSLYSSDLLDNVRFGSGKLNKSVRACAYLVSMDLGLAGWLVAHFPIGDLNNKSFSSKRQRLGKNEQNKKEEEKNGDWNKETTNKTKIIANHSFAHLQLPLAGRPAGPIRWRNHPHLKRKKITKPDLSNLLDSRKTNNNDDDNEWTTNNSSIEVLLKRIDGGHNNAPNEMKSPVVVKSITITIIRAMFKMYTLHHPYTEAATKIAEQLRWWLCVWVSLGFADRWPLCGKIDIPSNIKVETSFRMHLKPKLDIC